MWQCGECFRAGRNVTNEDKLTECGYCDAPRNSVKRDLLTERWRHSQAAMRVIHDTPVFEPAHSPLDTEPEDRWRFADALLSRDAFFWVCIIIALGLAYFAGYASGEAR